MKHSFYLLLIIFFLTSCSQRIMDFTMISTKNIPITNEDTKLNQGTHRVQGYDKAHSVLFFLFKRPDLKEAVDNAIEGYPNAVGLTDGVIYFKSWSCFFYGQSKYIVEGTPIYPIKEEVKPKIFENNEPTEEIKELTAKPNTNSRCLTHIVMKGESLYKIAKQYHVSVPDLIEWNNLAKAEVHPKMKLIIYIK